MLIKQKATGYTENSPICPPTQLTENVEVTQIKLYNIPICYY